MVIKVSAPTFRVTTVYPVPEGVSGFTIREVQRAIDAEFSSLGYTNSFKTKKAAKDALWFMTFKRGYKKLITISEGMDVSF